MKEQIFRLHITKAPKLVVAAGAIYELNLAGSKTSAKERILESINNGKPVAFIPASRANEVMGALMDAGCEARTEPVQDEDGEETVSSDVVDAELVEPTRLEVAPYVETQPVGEDPSDPEDLPPAPEAAPVDALRDLCDAIAAAAEGEDIAAALNAVEATRDEELLEQALPRLASLKVDGRYLNLVSDRLAVLRRERAEASEDPRGERMAGGYRTVTMRLTDEERAEMSARCLELLDEEEEHLDAAKQAADTFKAKAKLANAERRRLHAVLKEGMEEREIRVNEFWKEGESVIRVFDAETGAELYTRKPTDDERQVRLYGVARGAA